uniref:C2H2-type domain-containing protein n=1 Tax=Labrus bergylta TaxID=56723 RepID=A0A3Q3GGS6_9LABR
MFSTASIRCSASLTQSVTSFKLWEILALISCTIFSIFSSIIAAIFAVIVSRALVSLGSASELASHALAAGLASPFSGEAAGESFFLESCLGGILLQNWSKDITWSSYSALLQSFSPKGIVKPMLQDNVSQKSPVESRASDRLLRNSGQKGSKEDGEQCGTSEDFSALSSARSPADSNHEEDDNEVEEEEEEEWKPDKEEKEEKVDSSEITKRKRVKDSGVKSKRRKQIKSSVKVASDSSGVPVSCKVCRALSGSENMLIKHSWSHVEDPERLCGVCGEQSETPEELRTHLKSHKKTFSCDVCGKNFLSVVGFQRHAVLHTGEKPYECDVCLKKYASKNTLRNHRLVHVEEKPHRCDVCDKTFVFKQQLRTHAVSHTGEKPYTCDLCGKSTFAIERTLKSHRLGHVEEKPHKCHVCQKSFAFKQLLMNHSRSHTGEKPYTCDLCGKSVSDFRSLSRHKMSHSGRKRYSYPFF